MFGGRSARKRPAFVHLKVASENPKDDEAKLTLIHFLEKMGYSGLLAVPSGVFDHPHLATKLIGQSEELYEGRLRANPEHWQADFWRLVYNFSDNDVKVVERVDKWTAGEFLRSPDPKDGCNLRDLKDPDARIVIRFLNPIFHPKKPKRIVSKWASTFLGAMWGKCTVV